MSGSPNLPRLVEKAHAENLGIQGFLAIASLLLDETCPKRLLTLIRKKSLHKKTAEGFYQQIVSSSRRFGDTSLFVFLVGDPAYEMNLLHAALGLSAQAEDKDLALEVLEDWTSENSDFPYISMIQPLDSIDFGVRENSSPNRTTQARRGSNAILGGGAVLAALAISSQKVLGG